MDLATRQAACYNVRPAAPYSPPGTRDTIPVHQPPDPVHKPGCFARWHATPLPWRILGAVVLGAAVGVTLDHTLTDQHDQVAGYLLDVAKMILGLLMAVAVPLIFTCVVHALATAQIDSRMGRRLVGLLLANTLVAIALGLLVGNLLQPGRWGAPMERVTAELKGTFEPWEELKKKVPTSVVGSLAENKVIPTIVVALALGAALRRVRAQSREGSPESSGIVAAESLLGTGLRVLLVTLHWVIDLIPVAVFGIVAKVVMTSGFKPFISLAGFVVAVLLALTLQAAYYLVRVSLQSWVRPGLFLRGGAEALMAAFCTASSTATAPLNYTCLRERIGLRESSASMGALVGSNFNNDGTALYEAIGPMYIAQAIQQPIPLVKQPVVALMAVVASVGAPGIPEAGLVTMVLVFQSVGLPVEYVAFLLPVDWFLDRCRTAINLMGDMAVACILDGKLPEAAREVK